MRIVAGNLKGRIIKTAKGIHTRPTADKVKESLFNALGQYFDCEIVLDLFAGSGNLGIESISRGASKCVFIDNDYNAYKMIKENISNLKIDNICEVYKMDAFQALNYFIKNNYKFDIVFLDPPYDKQIISDIIKVIIENNLLNEHGIIVAETLKDTIITASCLSLVKEYIYGITKITLFKSGEIND